MTTEIRNVVDLMKSRGETIRPHQIEGVEFMMKTKDNKHGCILADEMGLGKTCQSALILQIIKDVRDSNTKHMVICPLSVLDHWQSEINRFAPSIVLHVLKGTKEERQQLRDVIEQDKTWDCLLTTYELFAKDVEWFQTFHWDCFIVDEGHRLKNDKSMLHNSVKQTPCNWLLLLTGTPIQNNMHELYSLLSLVCPSAFPGEQSQDFVDKNDIANVKKILSQYMLRRTKDTVCADIPNKDEVLLYHGITPLQKRLYKAILQKNYGAFESNNSREMGKQGLMNILVHLRKCIDHPYLFQGVEPEPFEEGEHLIEASGKLHVLDELLQHCKSNGHRVLLFSQMTTMLDIIQDYLTYRGYSYERLDGSVRGEERFAAVNRFNHDQSQTFCFLLSTKAGGVGLNLTSADTVIFVDSDFNPQNDIQAAARAHRIGQNKPVKIIRLIGKHSVEEVIIARAAKKLALTKSIMEDGDKVEQLTAAELTEMLTYGLKQLTDDQENNPKQQLNIDFATIIGDTKNERWMPVNIKDVKKESVANGINEDASINIVESSIYMFEGHDYKEDQRLADKLALDQLIDVGKKEDTNDTKRKGVMISPLKFDPKPAKILTAEELEERKGKRELAAQKRKERLEAEKQEMAQANLQKKLNKWKQAGYTSTNLPDFDVTEEENESKDNEEEEIVPPTFFVGDVTQPTLPQQYTKYNALILHCVDNSGSWGSGGVFTALDNRSKHAQDTYIQAHAMYDLQLGDAHIVPVNDVINREGATDFAVLLVAINKKDRSGIDTEAFIQSLRRVMNHCKSSQEQFTVHLPRIGYGMPKVKWYGIERSIRKELCSHAIPTFIYYFKRKVVEKRKADDSSNNTSETDAKRRPSSEIASTSKKSTSSESKEENYNLPQYLNSRVCQIAAERFECGLPLLDSLFEDYTMYLGAMDATNIKKYTRLIIAFDGQLTSDLSDVQLSHVIVGNETVTERMNSQLSSIDSTVQVVTQAWVDACVANKQIVPTDIFAFTEEDP